MSLLLNHLAMICLCLSMARHQRDLISRVLPQGPSIFLRLLGAAALVSSFAAAAAGGGLRLVTWFGEATIAIVTIASLLSWATTRRAKRYENYPMIRDRGR